MYIYMLPLCVRQAGYIDLEQRMRAPPPLPPRLHVNHASLKLAHFPNHARTYHASNAERTPFVAVVVAVHTLCNINMFLIWDVAQRAQFASGRNNIYMYVCRVMMMMACASEMDITQHTDRNYPHARHGNRCGVIGAVFLRRPPSCGSIKAAFARVLYRHVVYMLLRLQPRNVM